LGGGVLFAQVPAGAQAKLQAVGVDEKLGDALPLEREFTTHTGLAVKLGDFFPGDGQPVILTFNYADCPKLCGTQLDGFAKALEGLDGWVAGDKFRIVSLGIDPTETVERSAEVQARMQSLYPTMLATDAVSTDAAPTDLAKDQAWTFLTGNEVDIQAVADTAGFRYAFDPVSGQYSHTAALIYCTPDGRIARYLYGLTFPVKNLRLALAETAAGELRSTKDRILLFCFSFDPEANRYVLAAWNITRLIMGAVALVLGGFVIRLFRRNATRPAKA
jgi:protein SCO1